MKRAKDILRNSVFSYFTIKANAMVLEAFHLMEKENTDFVIVMEGAETIGIISEVDYMHKVILARKDPSQTSVKEIMSCNICSVDSEEPIHRCMELMDTFKIHHLLVFEVGSLKGVISLHDMMHAIYLNSLGDLMKKEQEVYNISFGIPGNLQHYANLGD